MDNPLAVNQTHQECKNDLMNAVALLINARRQVIELYYFNDLLLPEIAEVGHRDCDRTNIDEAGAFLGNVGCQADLSP
jgi:predicted DNA-binding protein YlxM (UPF0122 family)